MFQLKEKYTYEIIKGEKIKDEGYISFIEMNSLIIGQEDIIIKIQDAKLFIKDNKFHIGHESILEINDECYRIKKGTWLVGTPLEIYNKIFK